MNLTNYQRDQNVYRIRLHINRVWSRMIHLR